MKAICGLLSGVVTMAVFLAAATCFGQEEKAEPTTNEEKPAPKVEAPARIEDAAAASDALAPLRQTAVAVDTALDHLLEVPLAEADAKRRSGDEAVAKGDYAAAVKAYKEAERGYAAVAAGETSAAALKRWHDSYRELLRLVEAGKEADVPAELVQNAEKSLAEAKAGLKAADYPGALKSLEAGVHLLEKALLGPGIELTQATLEMGVTARTDALIARAMLLDENELRKMVEAGGSRPADAVVPRPMDEGELRKTVEKGGRQAGARQQSPLQLLAQADAARKDGEAFLDKDEFVKAIFAFVSSKRLYERTLAIQTRLRAALTARTAMLSQAEAASKASPAQIRSLAFERAAREAREAELAFREARYQEAEGLYAKGQKSYQRAEEEGRAYGELLTAEKQWQEKLLAIDRTTVETYMPEELKSLLAEAGKIEVLRRANDPVAALKLCRGATLRLEAIAKEARLKRTEAESAKALAEAKEALGRGDREAARQAVLKVGGAASRELLEFAKQANLSLLSWSFDADLQGWAVEGSPTVWHFVREESATGGGGLRASVPGQSTYTNNARTTFTCPQPVDLTGFERPTLCFRHRVQGEANLDKIAVTVVSDAAPASSGSTSGTARRTIPRPLRVGPGVLVWNEVSGTDWKDARVDLSKVKDKSPCSLVFTFTSDGSNVGPGAWLDEVSVIDAASQPQPSPKP